MENTMNWFAESVYPWIVGHGWKVLAIIVVAFIAHAMAGYAVEGVVRRAIRRGHHVSEEAEKKREDTLIQVLRGALGIVIWMAALMTVLPEFGIAIGPLLAAAGVVGLALGFGGQYLIRDLISGTFIIAENQYRTGDTVCLGSTCGSVENITLRMTTLRDLDGTVHHVPHGEVHIVSNLSKVYSRVNIDIGVSYVAPLEEVIAVTNAVGQELADDPAWKNMIVKAPAFLRVDTFGDSAVIIKILGETLPGKQWDVAGELRMRLKIAYDKAGIEIPFPQRVIHQAPSK